MKDKFYSTILKSSFLLSFKLSILATTNIVIGLLYQWYIITNIGPGIETDALFAGMVIPQLVLSIASSSLTFVLVPLLSVNKTRNFSKDSWTFFQSIAILFFGIAIILFSTADYWVKLIVPGFSREAELLTIDLVKIQLVGMVFSGLIAVLWSANHAKEKFIWVEISAIISNILGFLFLIWGLTQFGIIAGAWAMVIKAGLQMVTLLPSLGKYHKPDWKSPSFNNAIKLVLPLLIGSSYYKTDRLVDRFFASMAFAGGLSLYHIAQQIYMAGSTVLGKAVTSPMVPELSKLAELGKWKEFKQLYIRRLSFLLSLAFIGSLLLISIGFPLLEIIFNYNEFSTEDIETLWALLIALSGVWIGGVMGQILSSAFYTIGDTKTPTKIGSWGFTLGIAFKIIGFYIGGIMGIAIGTSIYYILNAGLLFFFFNKKLMNTINNE